MTTLLARSSGAKLLRDLRLTPGLGALYPISTSTQAVLAAAPQQSACMDGLRQDKTAIRKQLKQTLREACPEDLGAESRSIAQKIMQSEMFARSTRIGVYIHCPQLREVDTELVIAATLAKSGECKCYVPIVEDRNSNMRMVHLDDPAGLEPVPPFNILEPKPFYLNTQKQREDAMDAQPPLDLLILPGLGFDEAGHRLGRGGGYYDKFLSRCKTRAEQLQLPAPLLVACAFECQLVKSVPTGEDDQDMDVIVTADRVLKCSPRGLQQWN